MKRAQRPGKIAETRPPAAKPRHAWALLALGIMVPIAYSNSFRAGLIYDNAVLIFQDPRLHALTPHNLFLILSGGYWSNDPDTGLYRPLTSLSFLLNYTVFGNGPQPASYHWVNLALHEINVVLVYALGMLIFERRGASFAVAALWGLHPLATEAVTNVVGRADLLATFGVLAGVLCYARYTRSEGRSKPGWLLGLAAAQTAGILSKEGAAVLPIILVAYDWICRRDGQPKRLDMRFLLPYAATIVPVAAYLCLRGSLGIHFLPNAIDNPIVGAGLLAGRLTALEVLGKLIWLFLWPAQLSADYSYRAIPVLDWREIGGEEVFALLTAGILVAATWFAVRRGGKALHFFPLFFWIAWLPTSNLPIAIGSIMAERFLYLPSIGLAGIVVAAALRWVRVPERAWWGILAASSIALAARTYSRNSDWTDERSLWTSAVAVSPGSARAHNNLGTALPLDPEHLPEIIAEFEAAVRIRPDFAEAHNNLGNALLHMPGRQQSGIAEYRAALRLRPDYAEAHSNLGNALLQAPGDLPDAIAEYQAVVRLRPGNAAAHNDLGNALLGAPGRLPDAIGELQTALRIRPDYAEAHYNLGVAFQQMPDLLRESIAQFEAALAARPDFAEAHFNLGNALLRAGQTEEAVGHYQTALRLAPDVAAGHYNLAHALLQIPGRLPEAIDELEKALQLRPDFAEAHYDLAMVLRRVPGREADASREMAVALRLRPDLGRR